MGDYKRMPTSLPRHRRGLALLLVVGILSILLIVGMLFSQSLSLDFRSAMVARDQVETAATAEMGLHQAIAFLQYDMWGPDQTTAFACSGGHETLTGPDGQPLSNALQAKPDGKVAFYLATPDGFRPITAPVSKQRRMLSRIPTATGAETGQDHPVFPLARNGVRVVENDLDWVINDSADYRQRWAPDFPDESQRPAAQGFPFRSGAPVHDEFLPGPFDTDRLSANNQKAAEARKVALSVIDAERRASVPAGRFGTPAEFGAVVAFLCSAHAGYITGQNLLIDGGLYPGAV